MNLISNILKAPYIRLVLAWFLVASFGPLSFSQKANQDTFPSADKASQALFAAVESNEEYRITQVLGGGKELTSCGDELEDQRDREVFLQKYGEMHRLVQEPNGTMILYIGAENWPFPVPLISKKGAWFFDADGGAQEVLFRRVGENEDNAIDTSLTLHTGGQVPSGVWHGYYFRKLVEKGKNGTEKALFIAYPVEYRSSGIMTFVVTPNNIVFEKDLGPQTSTAAKNMSHWKADSTWHRAE